MFEKLCPGEEFLPKAPNPEDIIYDDGEAGDETGGTGFEQPDTDTGTSTTPVISTPVISTPVISTPLISGVETPGGEGSHVVNGTAADAEDDSTDADNSAATATEHDEC